MARANVAKILEQKSLLEAQGIKPDQVQTPAVVEDDKDASSTPPTKTQPKVDSAPLKPAAIPPSVNRVAPDKGLVRVHERKGAVLFADQLTDLDVLARRLNRSKTRRGPRITANTLLRIATDLLLQQDDRVLGNDENELRKSVGLKVSNLATATVDETS